MVYLDDVISGKIPLIHGRILIMWYGIVSSRYKCVDGVCGTMYTMGKAGYIGQTSNLVRGLDDWQYRLTGLH